MAIGRSRPTEVLTVQAAQAALAAQIEQVKSQISTARELLSFLTGFSHGDRLKRWRRGTRRRGVAGNLYG